MQHGEAEWVVKTVVLNRLESKNVVIRKLLRGNSNRRASRLEFAGRGRCQGVARDCVTARISFPNL